MKPPPTETDGRAAPRGWLTWWRRWWSAPRGEPPVTASDRPGPRRRHRERVALLVREVMIRHGVLSSRYRVRVLSLDRTGQQHLVLIDWLPLPGGLAAGPTPDGGRLEAEVQTDAQQTLGLTVRAVYWRGQPLGGAGGVSGPRN